ncbi:MAG TPA: creatininase family protein [Chryseosolibacter sp.]|nr:creatininase family protein [Chryseosolibacter sp.]
MHFSHLTYKKLNALAGDRVALLPLGAHEQHGPHLSVSTDTSLVTAVAERAEAILRDDIILLPTLPFGSSDHHLFFGGTASIGVATYTQMIVELVESLLESRFRRIILLNGHGGNITPVRQALSILSNKKHPSNPNVALATYWELGGKFFSGVEPMESPALSHACEYETSMMLHVYPERVFPEEIQRARRPKSNGYIAWEDDEAYRGVTMVKPTENISSNGSSGEPQLGTAEKGKHLIDQAVNALVTFVNSFKTWPFSENLARIN